MLNLLLTLVSIPVFPTFPDFPSFDCPSCRPPCIDCQLKNTPIPTQTPTLTPVPTTAPSVVEPSPTRTPDNPSPSPVSSGPTNSPNTNQNPIVEGVVEGFGGSVLGQSDLPSTADRRIPAELPDNSQEITGYRLVIPRINIDEPVHRSMQIGTELVVANHKVMLTNNFGASVFYAHNGTDIFGMLYALKPGDIISTNRQYQVSRIVYSSQTEILTSMSPDQIALVTCSTTYPDKRIIVIAAPI